MVSVTTGCSVRKWGSVFPSPSATSGKCRDGQTLRTLCPARGRLSAVLRLTPWPGILLEQGPSKSVTGATVKRLVQHRTGRRRGTAIHVDSKERFWKERKSSAREFCLKAFEGQLQTVKSQENDSWCESAKYLKADEQRTRLTQVPMGGSTVAETRPVGVEDKRIQARPLEG